MIWLGAGRSDLSAYEPAKYGTLDGYAADLLDICEALDWKESIFVGQSVSATVGVIAGRRRPGLVQKQILVGPSPCYINDGDYVGGFERKDIDDLLEFLDSNYLGWSAAMAPVIMGRPDQPELGDELTNSFCRTDPGIAKQFARVTFLSDSRAELRGEPIPSLILQCSRDAIAPLAVGEYVHTALSGSELVVLKATGHCPHLSAPEETIQAIQDYLQ